MSARSERRDLSAGSTSGFTLLELLVSVTVLSLIMLVLFGTLRLGTRVWERTESHGVRISDIGQVQALMREAIVQTYPLYMVDAARHGSVDFSGRPDSIRFLGPAPRAISASGRAHVTFRQETIDGYAALVIDVTAELATESRGSHGSEVLLTGLQSVRFFYFGPLKVDEPPSWHDTWGGLPRLPDLVRVEVQFPTDDGRVWPDFFVKPSITAEVSCTYDPLTRGCQGR